MMCAFLRYFTFFEIRKIYTAFSRRGRQIWHYLHFLCVFEEKEMLESKFQRELIGELKEMFPGAIVYKNESKQGLPDLTVLYGKHWALLECKQSESAGHQPNQDYYVERANEMSFSRFIYPENKQEVLDELQQAFRTGRQTRHSQSK